MTYKISSLQPILDCFRGNVERTPGEISDMLQKSTVIVHKYLKELVEQGKLKKVGLGAHVKYILTSKVPTQAGNKSVVSSSLEIPYKEIEVLEQSFLKFAENGEILQGVRGFAQRCQWRNFDIIDKAHQYYKVKTHIDSIKNECGLIDTTKVFAGNVASMHMNKVYYADQYNWMEFGRGKLAEMTFYAKQSQNLALITQCIAMIQRQIECLVRHAHIDAIAIVPPSITRIHQLLKIVKKHLIPLGLPFVDIVKYYPHKIPVPQKSLKSREQRIRNAQDTILINDNNVKKYKNILLIDDFVGSGSTLNETAGKLKTAGAKSVIGFAFVGNANLQYEVINEV